MRTKTITILCAAVFLLAATLLTGCDVNDDINPITPDVSVTGTYELNIGEPLSSLALTGTASFDGRTVAGSLAWKAPAATYDKADTYDAVWVFTPDDAGRFVTVEGTVRITVAGKSRGAVIARFRELLYKDGDVHANHLNRFEATEWSVVVEDPAKPLSVFTDITGIAAPLKETYEYKYTSSDGRCFIRIKGRLKAGWDAIYATMYVRIEDCPEITLLHFTTEDFLKEADEDYVGTEPPGVPVIW